MYSFLQAEKFQKASIYQYKLEERSTVAKRMLSYKSRVNKLLDCMINDHISTKTHVKMLKETIFEYTNHEIFLDCKNMGEILNKSLVYLKENFESGHFKINRSN